MVCHMDNGINRINRNRACLEGFLMSTDWLVIFQIAVLGGIIPISENRFSNHSNQEIFEANVALDTRLQDQLWPKILHITWLETAAKVSHCRNAGLGNVYIILAGKLDGLCPTIVFLCFVSSTVDHVVSISRNANLETDEPRFGDSTFLDIFSTNQLTREIRSRQQWPHLSMRPLRCILAFIQAVPDTNERYPTETSK